MKVTLIVVLLIVAAVASAQVPQVLRPGQGQPDTLRTLGVFTQYTFTAKAGNGIDIVARSNSFDTFLLLWGPEESEIVNLHNDDFETGGTDSRITFRADATGEYMLEVQMSDHEWKRGKRGGDYEISLHIDSSYYTDIDREVIPEVNVHVGVATSLPSPIDATAVGDWKYWTFWDKDSSHGLRMLAQEECGGLDRDEKDRCELVGMSGTRGSCVCLVRGTWYDPKSKNQVHAGFLESNSFEEVALESAMSHCTTHIGIRKAETYECRPIVMFCSERTSPRKVFETRVLVLSTQ